MQWMVLLAYLKHHHYLPPADGPGTGDYKMPNVRSCVRSLVFASNGNPQTGDRFTTYSLEPEYQKCAHIKFFPRKKNQAIWRFMLTVPSKLFKHVFIHNLYFIIVFSLVFISRNFRCTCTVKPCGAFYLKILSECISCVLSKLWVLNHLSEY